MLKAIIRFSATHRLLVIGAVLVTLVLAVGTMRHIPLDALPDLSDTQVIVYAKWDRSPDIIEDQVTYPITTALLGAPRVKAIRGYSDFGFSYVYAIFEDGTDIYWARTRVLEYLSKIADQLPAGVRTELGPDATAVGWVFQYALVDRSGKHTSDELRSFQDWFLRYGLQSVPGVAEVATVGGQVRQYQVTVNPTRLAAHRLPLAAVLEAVRKGNNDVGGRLVELSGREYMVRGRGYLKSSEDIEKLVLKTEGGTPVQIKDVAEVSLGPEMRRGIADYNGQGDVVGGIVVMRQGENALRVIERVKAKLAELQPSFPAGVEVVTTYDRAVLIDRAIDTVKDKLVEEVVIVSLVILLFLWHIPSSIVPILTIPISVALAFIPMYLMGLNANLMSLAGIAISVGVLVDGAIVEVENAYNKIYRWQAAGRVGDFHQVRLEALLEVGPAVFFSLLVIAVAFMPVFTLVDQEGRLFRPLAYSKNLAMAIAALLAITLDPAMRMLFARSEPFVFRPRPLSWLATRVLVGTYHAEERHPVSRLLHRLYEPPCRFVLRHAVLTLLTTALVVASTVYAYGKLGSEFMPPLREGTLLYMPSAVEPGMSVAEAERALQLQDKLLMTFPEVERVFGKAGRASTSTDPAPLSMMETTVLLRPESAWRAKPRWYSSWAPGWLQAVLRNLWRDRISEDELVTEMNAALQLPGISNAWTMPIKGRLDMLSTGIRTPVGIKVSGADLGKIQELALAVEGAVGKVSGVRSVYAERVTGGFFLDFVLDRDHLARYGLSVDDANMMVMTAVGGDNQTTTIEGRQRYGVNVRYARDYREDLTALGRVLLPLPNGAGQIPMSAIAELRLVEGPSMIRDENGLLAGYVYVDFDTSQIDIGTFVARAKAAVASAVATPAGYSLSWSGQYENMLRVKERLKVILPVTLVLIFVLLSLNTKSTFKAAVVMLAVPFSAVGAIWLLYFLGYNLSIAVWVGLIALMGLDAETGVFMLLFLDLSFEEARAQGRLRTREELVEAVIHGAVKRVRPKAMTVTAAFMGLLPIMWSSGTGADLMKRIAAPMVGGLFTSFLLELLVYPAVYFLWRQRELTPEGSLGRGTVGRSGGAVVRTVRWSWLVSWVVVFVSGSPARAASLFEDPVLQGLLADAEKHRPELARAHAEITASRERALQASVLPDPTLAFGIQNDGFRSIQIGRMETSWLYFIGSQTLPWFGKRALRQELADTEAKRDGAALGRATLSLRAEIARAYLDLLLARDQLALLAKLDALWRQSEGTARARYETGEGAQSDLLRAQLERSRLRLRSITASAEESRRLELLNSLRGAPAETGLATTVHLVDLADPPLPSWEDALGEAERRSPELRRARIEGEVARNARSLAGRELLPDITVTAGVMPRGGLAPMWQAGLALSLPVWSRGRQPHLLNERASLEARAGAEQDDLRRRLAARVRERLRLLKAASESHALYRGGLLIQSAATVTSSLAQYRVGRVPFSAVLEAIASHINDEESFLQSIVGAHRVAIGLEEVSLEEPAAGGALGGASATMSARPVLETAPVVSPGRGAMVGGM